MKVVIIQGPSGSGKTTMLEAGCKDAGAEARLFSATEFESILRMVERKMLGLPFSTFVDEVPAALMPKIRKIAKMYSDEYIITLAMRAST